ncbi:hypothetical protein GCM10020221_14560 [Streptomyces thioluteus]|uniref:Uncharacterized protein n=1 Tax=Streptomyces thioluteus TaxID=66431 RepID=A0ABN3WK46_STRTU
MAKGVHGNRFVLVGIATSAILVSVIGYLLTKANLTDAARATLWMVGSLNGRDWSQVWRCCASAPCSSPSSSDMAAACGCWRWARTRRLPLGVRVERTRLTALTCAVLLAAGATAAAGPIAFVALSAAADRPAADPVARP